MSNSKKYIKKIMVTLLIVINVYNLWLSVGLTNGYELFIAYLTWILPYTVIQLIVSIVMVIKKKQNKNLTIAGIIVSLLTLVVATVFVFVRYAQY